MDYSHLSIGNAVQTTYLAPEAEEERFLPLTSLEFLKMCGTKGKRLREGSLDDLSFDLRTDPCWRQTLSTASIVKLAKARLIKLNSRKADVLSYVARCIRARSGLHSEVPGDMELALLLQAAAEKVANQQFMQARKLLSMCGRSASKSGNPVQRVVYYFAEALQKRIDLEWGLVSSVEVKEKIRSPMDVEKSVISLQPAMMTAEQEKPFTLFIQFTATESILNSVASAKRVHLIDFNINSGSHWTLIMQAFADRHECPLERLKITAVGASRKIMEETGNSLSSFAENLNSPFLFKTVVSHLKDLKEDFFELEADEVLAVYMDMRLWTQLAWPSHLKTLIGVIKNLKPRLMVVVEMEASTDTPIFLERFNAAVIHFSAMFDCINSCMDHYVPYRKMTEEFAFQKMIHNIMTTEGVERVFRFEKVGFWRALFGEFGFVETDLIRPSLCEASLFLRSSERLNSCTVDMDGKCLILGWKGTPFQSLSAWKFQDD